MRTVIFDLDGTISDPSEGITAAINYSLEALGMKTRPSSDLLRFIGPPLSEIFKEILPDSQERGIALFREYYRKCGYRENILYSGITGVLEKLTENGFVLCIATGKKTVTAEMVLSYFGIARFFTEVHGCGDGGSKAELLTSVIDRYGKNAVMIGDRDTDFASAREVGIHSIGARWGFAEPGELSQADAVADKPEDLSNLVARFLEE